MLQLAKSPKMLDIPRSMCSRFLQQHIQYGPIMKRKLLRLALALTACCPLLLTQGCDDSEQASTVTPPWMPKPWSPVMPPAPVNGSGGAGGGGAVSGGAVGGGVSMPSINPGSIGGGGQVMTGA